MIVVRPDTDAARLLQALVEFPGELDAEALGVLVFGPRRPDPRRPSTPARASWLEDPASTGYGRDLARWRSVVVAGRQGWTTRASRLLGRLQEAGLVERRRPPELMPDHEGSELVVALCMAAEDHAASVSTDGTHLRLLRALVERAPSTVTEWVGSSPAGSVQRALRDLVDWGLVRPPAWRWPTEAAVELVAGWAGVQRPVQAWHRWEAA